MAIGKGSLFSFKAQGRIGKNTVLRSVKGQTVSSTYKKSAAPATAAQIAARGNYQNAVAEWHGLLQVDRDYWAAQKPQLSTNKGFSNFIKYYLEGGDLMQIYETKGHDLGYEIPVKQSGIWEPIEQDPAAKMELYNGNYAQLGDWFEVDISLPAGTYYLESFIRKFDWAAIIEISIDGGEPSIIDLWWPVPLTECWLIKQDCIFPNASIHTVKVEVVGKNPASPFYYVSIADILFRRTA